MLYTINLLRNKIRFSFTLAEGAMHTDLSPIKMKLGFTLAEVLITLGIIGVVAAMTIPNLIANNKAQKLRSQFLKSYSVVQQVFKQMEADDISLTPSDYNPNKGSVKFYKTFIKYLQAPMDCGGSSTDSSPKNALPCYYTAEASTMKQYKIFDGKKTLAYNYLDDGQIVLQDGTNLFFENSISTDYIWISVDLNGYKNPPNRWGYDLFTFQFKEGELVTMGDPKTDYSDLSKYCNINSSDNLNGIACAQKAKTDTEYFKWVVKNLK